MSTLELDKDSYDISIAKLLYKVPFISTITKHLHIPKSYLHLPLQNIYIYRSEVTFSNVNV